MSDQANTLKNTSSWPVWDLSLPYEGYMLNASEIWSAMLAVTVKMNQALGFYTHQESNLTHSVSDSLSTKHYKQRIGGSPIHSQSQVLHFTKRFYLVDLWIAEHKVVHVKVQNGRSMVTLMATITAISSC